MEKDVESIKEEALKFTWYMRGGVSYTEALQLSAMERRIINRLVKENIETTKKTGLPWF